MRNKSKLWVLLVSGLVALTFAACEPLFSLEYRIVGIWQLSHTYVNGEAVDSVEYIGFSPSAYYYFYADHMMAVRAICNGTVRESVASYYILDSKTKKIEISYSLYGHQYHFIADIDRLTRKDFFIEFDDEKGDHWRLEMFSRSN